MKYVSAILDFLFFEIVGMLQFVIGVVWIMVDASFTSPGLWHLGVFILISIWLGVALFAESASSLFSFRASQIQSR